MSHSLLHQQNPHPLDNEAVTVTVVVTHLMTGQRAEASVHCPSDEQPNVHEAVEQASNKALDELLDKLEITGGG